MLLAAAVAAAAPVALPWLDGECVDPRFPRLAGPWAVGCGPSGMVDRAQHLETGQQLQLEQAAASPATAPGLLIAPGVPTWNWRLPETAPARGPAVPVRLLAPPATDGQRVVLSTSQGLEWFAVGERERHHLSPPPAPWYPPAVTGPWTAWVSLERGQEAIWLDRDGEVRRIAAGDHPRHPAAQGGWLGWISDAGVSLLALESGERRDIATDAHTSRSLSLWDGVACWEAWGGSDVDIACSDGVRIDGPGHQRQPSRWEGWLLYRDQGRVRVVEVAAEGR